jgi:hypothetical protein
LNVREGDESELGNQECYFPGLVPKIPGRFYYYFGKPIETAGMYLVLMYALYFKSLTSILASCNNGGFSFSWQVRRKN